MFDNVDKDVDKDSRITMTRDNTSETTQNSPTCGGNQCDQQSGNQDVTDKEQYIL